MEFIVRRLYTVLFFIALPFIIFRLWWRGRRLPAYRERWCERFGYIPCPEKMKGAIWIHAVSVGESVVAKILIQALRRHAPELPIVISTTTPTGARQVERSLGDQVFHFYFPYDVPWMLNRALDRLKPRALVLIETELWPNLLHACQKKSVPSFLVNARLSEKSAHGYHRMGRLARLMLNDLGYLFAQTAADATRFAALGVPEAKLHVTGNIKFDLSWPSDTDAKAQALRSHWGKRLVWIAASTHEGEEKIMLEVHTRLRAVYPELLLILVPRHPDRFDDVASLCGPEVVRRSQSNGDEAMPVFLGDSMGEMGLYFSCADVAFVGGSFVPIGGHNLLEPASLRVPGLTGPYVFNFTLVTEQLTEAGGATLVENEEQLYAKLQWLLSDAAARRAMGDAGHHVVKAHQGASTKSAELILENINETVVFQEKKEGE